MAASVETLVVVLAAVTAAWVVLSVVVLYLVPH